MDELAITPEPIRKRARIGNNKCDAQTVAPTSAFSIARIESLPVEIIFEIFSYLSCKDLYAVSHVSTLFNRLAYDPFLWRTYEVRMIDGLDPFLNALWTGEETRIHVFQFSTVGERYFTIGDRWQRYIQFVLYNV